MVKELAAIAFAYLFVLAGLYLFQRSLIYPAPDRQAALPQSIERVLLETADGLSLEAAYRPARAGKPTVVFFHGNGDNWGGASAATVLLAETGYGVLLPEYRGYAGNPGRPSEEGFYEDGRAAIAWLRRSGVAPDRIVIVGNSIGSGVAVQMATEFGPAALVLVSPFASLSGLAGEKLWWAPAALLVRDRYDNIGKIAAIDAPILLLHGTDDRVIPHRHSERLAKANARARLELFEGVGHDLAYRREAQTIGLQWLGGLGLGEPAR